MLLPTAESPGRLWAGGSFVKAGACWAYSPELLGGGKGPGPGISLPLPPVCYSLMQPKENVKYRLNLQSVTYRYANSIHMS